MSGLSCPEKKTCCSGSTMERSEQQVWAVIPARGGSKGIPRKNLVQLAGRPLIQYTIDEAIQAGCFDRVIVSSDDDDILHVAESLGAEVLTRPENLAQDHTPGSEAILHLLNVFGESVKLERVVIVLLQPTSPLRSTTHIREALELFISHECESVISVYEAEQTPLKCLVEGGDGYIHGIVDDRMPFMARQLLPKAYYQNGAIYIANAADYRRVGGMPMHSCLPYVMPRELSIDIDTPDDLYQAEMWLMDNYEAS